MSREGRSAGVRWVGTKERLGDMLWARAKAARRLQRARRGKEEERSLRNAPMATRESDRKRSLVWMSQCFLRIGGLQ